MNTQNDKAMKATPDFDSHQRRHLTVVGIVNVWRGIWQVVYRIKGPRHYRELYRQVNGAWCSGEAYPQGCYSSPLRQACPEIAAALDTITKTLPKAR